MKKILSVLVLLSLCFEISCAQKHRVLRETDPDFFKTAEARRVGDQVLLYQRDTGGWPKNVDMATQLTDVERDIVVAENSRRDDSTIDNNATSMQLYYLARLYNATKEPRYLKGIRKGVTYLLAGQYDNGGWPQFWPENRDYQIHITYNDNAMVNTMRLIRALADGESPFDGDIVDSATRVDLEKAFSKGVECILNTQIISDCQPTIWCQQHDHETLLPAGARTYELPSFCAKESTEIVKLLMSLPNPDERVKRAIHCAMRWFDKYKLTGLRLERIGTPHDPDRDVRLVPDLTADPLWARFYDLEHCEPYVCDRDGVPRKHLYEIGVERRTGYGWYTTDPIELYALYETWAQKHDPDNKVKINLHSKGANENGTFTLAD